MSIFHLQTKIFHEKHSFDTIKLLPLETAVFQQIMRDAKRGCSRR